MFARLYEEAGDPTLMEVARVALAQDLRRCYLREDGSLEVNEGWRTMPCLAHASAGIWLVIKRCLAHRDDDGPVEAAASRRVADFQLF